MILRRENFEICAKTRGDSREEDLYADETGRVVFGDDYSRYPLDFMKGALLFTTHIRSLFSGRKFTSFRDMLHDSVLPKHHKELKHIRPLFDDPEYDSFRRGNDLRTRPWDMALSGFNPADFEMGSQEHSFLMSTASTLGQGVNRIIRKLDQMLLPAWKSLSEVKGKRAWAEGSAMNMDQAVQYSLEEPESTISGQ